MNTKEKKEHQANQLAFNMKILFEIEDFHTFQSEVEKLWIVEKLKANQFNVSKTAIAIDIQRSHLYNKIKKYKIDLDRDSDLWKKPTVSKLIPVPKNLAPKDWWKAYEL